MSASRRGHCPPKWHHHGVGTDPPRAIIDERQARHDTNFPPPVIRIEQKPKRLQIPTI
jgi:hypothetical protein